MTENGNGNGKRDEEGCPEPTGPRLSIAEVVEALEEILKDETNDITAYAFAVVDKSARPATSLGFAGDGERGFQHTASLTLALKQIDWWVMRNHFQHQTRCHERQTSGIVGLDQQPLG
jgi:hypothetical protein